MAVLQGAGASTRPPARQRSGPGARRDRTGQDSCPLPPSAVPNSHRGWGGTHDHPLLPPYQQGDASVLGSSSGILCQGDLELGLGAK